VNADSFHSPSGVPIDTVYDRRNGELPELGKPGSYPYTRGIYPEMYRRRLWTMRQYAGFGNAVATNQRFRQLLAAGQTGLSVAFDLPTQMGIDSDARLAEGEVGRAGVAIDTVDDLAVVFEGIPLDKVSTSMTINASASVLLAMYIVVAEERGVARNQLRGTIQNDILKEYIARGTYIYPVEPSLRLVTDVFTFIANEGMSFNPISISGYHMREAGATAVEEIAFTFANAIEYLDRAVDCGIPIDEIAPRLSFFFAAHNDLFEEVAKFRAARRMWAHIIRDRYRGNDASGRLRFHTQTGGSMLTAQQPLNNVVRVTIQALAAILGGTQSLHTNGYDEALQLPSQEAAKLALRTQQVLAYESGVSSTVDPLGGSYFVEHLTDTLEQRANAVLAEVVARGGAAAALERGYFQDAIGRSAYRQQRTLETGEAVVVGVNRFEEDNGFPDVESPDFKAFASQQVVRLRVARSQRDGPRCDDALQALAHASAGDAQLMPLIIEAVRSRATVGEICDIMRNQWGTFRSPT